VIGFGGDFYFLRGLGGQACDQEQEEGGAGHGGDCIAGAGVSGGAGEQQVPRFARNDNDPLEIEPLLSGDTRELLFAGYSDPLFHLIEVFGEGAAAGWG
jgi:hypothetical protein